MSQEKKTIFDFEDQFKTQGPFNDWLEEREQQQIKTLITDSASDNTSHIQEDFDKSQSQMTTSTYFRDKEKRQYYLVRNVRVMNERSVNEYTREVVTFAGSYLPPRAKETKSYTTNVTVEFSRIISETAIFDLDGDLVYVDKDGVATTKELGTSTYLKEIKETTLTTTTVSTIKYIHYTFSKMPHKSSPVTKKVPETSVDTSVDYDDADWVFPTFSTILREFDAANLGHISIHKDYVMSQAESLESKMRTIGAVANIVPGVGRSLAGAARTAAGIVSFVSKASPSNVENILLYHFAVNPKKMKLQTWVYPKVEANGNITENQQPLRVINHAAAVPKGLLTDPDYLEYDKE